MRPWAYRATGWAWAENEDDEEWRDKADGAYLESVTGLPTIWNEMAP